MLCQKCGEASVETKKGNATFGGVTIPDAAWDECPECHWKVWPGAEVRRQAQIYRGLARRMQQLETALEDAAAIDRKEAGNDPPWLLITFPTNEALDQAFDALFPPDEKEDEGSSS